MLMFPISVHAIGKLAEWIIHKENNTLATWTLGPEVRIDILQIGHH